MSVVLHQAKKMGKYITVILMLICGNIYYMLITNKQNKT